MQEVNSKTCHDARPNMSMQWFLFLPADQKTQLANVGDGIALDFQNRFPLQRFCRISEFCCDV